MYRVFKKFPGGVLKIVLEVVLHIKTSKLLPINIFPEMLYSFIHLS